MKITFNLQSVGAGNNGGTATLFHSANTLSSLGHQVFVVSNMPNEFTWFKLNGPKWFETGSTLEYPDADILIATGVKSVRNVVRAPVEKGEKYWWIRAHETWNADENQLFANYRNSNINLIVNGLCLQKFIKSRMNKFCPIIRPGTDTDLFKPTRTRNWAVKKQWSIGALYNDKPRKRFEWVPEIVKGLKDQGLNVRLHLFGTEEKPEDLECSSYLMQPTPDELKVFYNKVDLWLAPTNSEGLHMPPEEAMLCGCVLFGADEELSGMVDYLKDGETGFIIESVSDSVEKILSLVGSKEGRKKLETISMKGRKKIRSLGDRKINMKMMVDLFKGLLSRKRDNNVFQSTEDINRRRSMIARGRRYGAPDA